MSNNDRFNAAMESLSSIREVNGLTMRGGKLYSMVKDRIEIFRRHFGSEFRIDTEIQVNDFANGSPVIAIAKITDSNGLVVASGHAMERIGSSNITTTNPVEMAETSAIGRALACFGLAGGEYASGDELINAITKDVRRPEPVNAVKQLEQAAPVKTASGFHVPDSSKNDWTMQELEGEMKEIEKDIAGVKDIETLGKYWSELRAFRDIMDKHDRVMIAELKAVFAQRNNQLAG